MLSAGCAIGIGNVWRFPYIAGTYGGGVFVLFYLFFLVTMGVPVMTMEFAAGRASRKSIVRSFQALEKPGQKWHLNGYLGMAGNYLLMMFYTTVTGWMLYYFYQMLSGKFEGKDTQQVGQMFSDMLASPQILGVCMVIVVTAGIFVCSMGLQKGVERITKIMMSLLLAIIIVLAVHSCTLKGGMDGLKFYLLPDFQKMKDAGVWETITAAMNQAFFTLSLGIGAMGIFGSYIDKKRSLLGESVSIAILDTFVALVSGLIIFPACFSFGVQPDSGPPLIFITLPKVFARMPAGQLFAVLFFLSILFAGTTSLVNMFEVVCEAAQRHLRLHRLPALALVGGTAFAAGMFIEYEPYLGRWMDAITIWVVPIGAVICAAMIYWVLGLPAIKKELMTGREKPLFPGFDFLAKYLYVLLAAVVVVLGVVFGGIG